MTRDRSGSQVISGFRVDPRLGHFHCVDFGLIDDLEIAKGAREQLNLVRPSQDTSALGIQESVSRFNSGTL